MGSVKVDLSKSAKRLDEQYPLDTFEGVYSLLNNIHHVREYRFLRGDFDASVLLMDFHESVRGAKITARQEQILHLTFEKDLRQEDVARLLGISQQAISDHVNSAIKRIANYNDARERGKQS